MLEARTGRACAHRAHNTRYGARRTYLAALALFTLGSALCAAAPCVAALIAARALQGLGGGLLLPIGLSVLYRLAPPHKRGAVLSAFGVSILVAPALGPLLAGWLVQHADWRAFFLVNAPVGLGALALGRRALPAPPAHGVAEPLDIRGALLAPLGCAALVYGLSASADAGWGGAPTMAGLAIGAGALALFVAHALRARYPLLDLRVVGCAGFARALLAQGLAQAALLGALALVPLFLQRAQGAGPVATGLALLPQALAAALTMPLGGRLFDRWGARLPVGVGLGLVALSAWSLAQATGVATGEDLRWPLALRGAGVGLLLMPLQAHLLALAPGVPASRVTALTGATQNVAGALGVAALATLARVGAHAGAPSAGFADAFLLAAALATASLLLALTPRRSNAAAADNAASAGGGRITAS